MTHNTPAGLRCITQLAEPTSSHPDSEPPGEPPAGPKLTCLHFGPPWECSNSAPVWQCSLNAARHPGRRTSGYTQPASSGELQDLHLKITNTQLRQSSTTPGPAEQSPLTVVEVTEVPSVQEEVGPEEVSEAASARSEGQWGVEV